MSTKAREFWIDSEPCDDEMPNCFDAFSEKPDQGNPQWIYNLIHVIEYSAYEELKKETAKLKRTNERLAMRYKELKEQLSRQNEIMAETLKLIASPSEFNCAVGEGNMRAAANAALAKCGKITNKRLRRDGMKYCSDLPLKFNCCNSCHEDYEEFNTDLLESKFNDEDYYVCCSAIIAMESEKK